MRGARGLVGLWSKHRERQGLRYVLSVRACARGLNLVVLLLCASELDRSNESGMTCLYWERVHPLL